MTEPMTREPMKLLCRNCGKTMEVSPEQQDKIIASLTAPAQTHLLECGCGRFVWSLGAVPARRTEVTP